MRMRLVAHAGEASDPVASTAAECVHSFDTALFPLRELVQSALGVQDLEKLHEYEPDDFPHWRARHSSIGRGSHGAQRRIELLRHALNQRWKGSPQRKEWECEHLPRLVREVIGPRSMAGEERLLFQRSPLLRFHVAWPLEAGEKHRDEEPLPGFGRTGHSPKAPGTLAMLHKDQDTGHPSSEVNFLLPVNLRTYGANSLWAESAPDRGDYAPFNIEYGEIVQWRGNSLRHYSHRNTCDETRVSFDFRVIPGSTWETPCPKSLFQAGSYYLDALDPSSGLGVARTARGEMKRRRAAPASSARASHHS